MNPMPHDTKNRAYVARQLERIGRDHAAERLVQCDPDAEPVGPSDWRQHAVAPLKDHGDPEAWKAGELLDRCLWFCERLDDGFDGEEE